jgi:hypothetical protein
MSCDSKIVVFDLDETLGYFSEFGMFWDALKGYIKSNNIDFIINQEFFNKTLDLYPEFLRPNIINILTYLKQRKKAKHCYKIMIYTNNQGPYEWSVQIKTYFEDKINYNLFDQVIGAYKVNGKQVELGRTTNAKTHSDLLKCTLIPETTDICFLDDVYHPGMSHDKVYYINIKAYEHDLPFVTIVDRFISSGLLNSNDPTSMKEYIIAFMKRYNYMYVEKMPGELAVDKALSKKILHHLQVFFNRRNKLTRSKSGKRELCIKTQTHRSKHVKNRTLKKSSSTITNNDTKDKRQ